MSSPIDSLTARSQAAGRDGKYNALMTDECHCMTLKSKRTICKPQTVAQLKKCPVALVHVHLVVIHYSINKSLKSLPAVAICSTLSSESIKNFSMHDTVSIKRDHSMLEIIEYWLCANSFLMISLCSTSE